MDPENLDALNAVLGTLTIAGSTEQGLRWVQHFWSRNDRAMQAASEQAVKDWLCEAIRAHDTALHDVQRRAASLEEAQAELHARVRRYDVWKVQQNYLFESLREPTEERRKMLAHATAAVVNLALSEAECARVERLLRELDPDDVRALRGLWMIAGGVVFEGTHYEDPDNLRFELWKRSESADALLSSGCIRATNRIQAGFLTGGSNSVTVTRVGRLVLQSLRTYLADRPLPFDVPGREMLEGSRAPADAWAMIDECGDLRDLAFRASYGRFVSYEFPKWPQKDKTPPRAAAKSSLRFFDVPETLTTRFDALPSAVRLIDLDGRLTAQIHRADDGKWEAAVFGPHDVLRHLADAIDARWV